ncbi:MAG: glutamyl-tRNA reductase [Chloroflexota bacterium]|nr:glutamyl-tRNA reductase [Chloroflexota bacterium]
MAVLGEGGGAVKLAVVGVNHRTAPLEALEQLAVVGEDLAGANRRLAEASGHSVVLHTCNRTEFYTLAEDIEDAREAAARTLAAYGIGYDGVAPYVYAYHHDAAARHLFRVTCSLDSMILGESEVLGQVREAFGAAVAAKTAHSPLTHAFHQALRVGKRARHDTDIGRNAQSVSYAFVELARRTLGRLDGAHGLVVGAGEAGRLAALALRNAGIGRLTVMNRTPHRAAELAEDLGGADVLPLDELQPALAAHDIVITATGSLDYVVTRADVAGAGRNGRPLLLLDAALPRDVDPAVRDVAGVTLADMSDLDRVAEVNRQRRQQEAARVEAIVEDEVTRFHEWWDSLRVVPTLVDLREQAESLRERELERALRRLSHLTDADQETVAALSRALVNKLLHNPVTRVKAEGRPEDIQTLRWLFRLDEAQPDGEPADGEEDPSGTSAERV